MKEIKNFLDLIPIIKLYPLWAQMVIFVCILIILSILFFVPHKTLPIQEKKSPDININKMDMEGDFVAGDKTTNNYNNSSLPEKGEGDINKKRTLAKIKIDRLFDDYKLNFENLRQGYYKESSRISSSMSSRNMGSSGIHIEAHMDSAIETRNKVNELFVNLTRNIEDILLENYDIHILEEIPALKEEYDIYVLLQDKNKDFFKNMVDSVQSWDVRINGSVSSTKNFILE